MLSNGGVSDIVVQYVAHVNDLRVNYGTSWSSASSQLPGTIQVTMNDFSTRTAFVSWNQGSYSSTTSISGQVTGTLSGVNNPNGVTAKAVVEVYHEGYNDLTAADGVFYDFHRSYTASGNFSNGEQGLEDLGPNGFDATIVNTPSRSLYQMGSGFDGPSIYGLSTSSNNCVSTGSTLSSIINSTRWDFFIEFLTLDGVPPASSNIFGFVDTGDGIINFYILSGQLNCTINDGTNFVTMQSSTFLVNGQNPSKTLHVKFDWTANTSTADVDGSSITWSVTGGSLAGIDQTSFTHTTPFYVGNINNNGSPGSHSEIIIIGRFAFVSDITDAAATRIVDFFRFNTYPFPSLNILFLYGDSQSEGAEIATRPSNVGAAAFTPSGLTYTLSPSRTIIYWKTARTSADNGSWDAAVFGTNTEFVSGANPATSNDLPLTAQILTRLGAGHNVMLMKCSQGGQRLSGTLGAPSGTDYVLATQYYWDVGYPKLTALYPYVYVKVVLDFDLGTNDASDAPSVAAFSANLDTLITSWRAYHAKFADCPIFLTENNTTLNATQVGMNVTLKSKAESYPNVYYLSGDPADTFGDALLRLRQQDMSTPQKLGISNPITGDDGHRSYIGNDQKAIQEMQWMTLIGHIPA